MQKSAIRNRAAEQLVDKHLEIDTRLAEAEEDIKAGRVHGPFATANEAVKALRSGARRKQR